MLKISSLKGYHMTFDNGYTVSVQFGRGNYCDNRYGEATPSVCKNAEVLAWDAEGEEVGEPIGWLTPDEVLAYMVKIASFPGLPEVKNNLKS